MEGLTIQVSYQQMISVRRFLQKNENRPKKTRVNQFFIKIRSKIETTVKKYTTRYSVLTQELNVRYFDDVIKFQTKSL
jgi:hypothetical protein